ncbi:hypothetical protein [Brevifollis gellanilyticus]|uniref:hypothetical protein n=1 Tax=Brevifollis gellanilyticus TaxID=748831 RepID=UPI0011BF6592|nr:hypothetical protein [Brevifollis gellanilyticus]
MRLPVPDPLRAHAWASIKLIGFNAPLTNFTIVWKTLMAAGVAGEAPVRTVIVSKSELSEVPLSLSSLPKRKGRLRRDGLFEKDPVKCAAA